LGERYVCRHPPRRRAGVHRRAAGRRRRGHVPVSLAHARSRCRDGARNDGAYRTTSRRAIPEPTRRTAMTSDAPKVHVHMTVSDLEKSRAFYEKFFGAAPVKVKPGYVKFLPAFGPLNLALSEAAPAESRGHVDHIGIQVESAAIVMRELARVKAAGLPVREEMGVDCCHANQDKFWVEDPDGVDWEVYVLNRDIDESPAGRTTEAAPLTHGLAVVRAAGGGCCGSSA